ncbi:MAG: ABC transporter ATP-binding protein [Thiotrichales bacterium]
MSGLVVTDLTHRFGPTEVLSHVQLLVAPGETVALVGPSGCGKTTLLNLCGGLLHPSEGEIVNGFSTTACMFQQPRLLPWKTASANIALGLKARGMPRSEREARAAALALEMGLARADLDKFSHELSGGMQSRVALARAFAIAPDLLLLDEPFSALDIGLKAELYELLLAHVAERQAGVLMITHDLMEAVRLAHRVLVMAPEPGRIVQRFPLASDPASRDDDFVYRTAGELMRAPAVRASFGLRAQARHTDAPKADLERQQMSVN